MPDTRIEEWRFVYTAGSERSRGMSPMIQGVPSTARGGERRLPAVHEATIPFTQQPSTN